MTRRCTLDAQEIREIAAKALCDPRSVRRYAEGHVFRHAGVATRIERAMRALHLTATREELRRLRAVLHNAKRDGQPVESKVVQRIYYLARLAPARVEPLRAELEAILGARAPAPAKVSA